MLGLSKDNINLNNSYIKEMDSEIRFIDSTVEEENLKINENSANNLEINNQRDKDQPEIISKNMYFYFLNRN
jgi:hypothetical protein